MLARELLFSVCPLCAKSGHQNDYIDIKIY